MRIDPSIYSEFPDPTYVERQRAVRVRKRTQTSGTQGFAVLSENTTVYVCVSHTPILNGNHIPMSASTSFEALLASVDAMGDNESARWFRATSRSIAGSRGITFSGQVYGEDELHPEAISVRLGYHWYLSLVRAEHYLKYARD